MAMKKKKAMMRGGGKKTNMKKKKAMGGRMSKMKDEKYEQIDRRNNLLTILTHYSKHPFVVIQ